MRAALQLAAARGHVELADQLQEGANVETMWTLDDLAAFRAAVQTTAPASLAQQGSGLSSGQGRSGEGGARSTEAQEATSVMEKLSRPLPIPPLKVKAVNCVGCLC